MDTNKGNLPQGERWETFDALWWITFGEVRAATDESIFPRQAWSRDWGQWPPQCLLFALDEIETGIPWQPGPDEVGPLGPDYDRKWARRIAAETGESPGQLMAALSSDTERYQATKERWGQALAEVNVALDRGKLRLWAIKCLLTSNSDRDGVHELIDPLIFAGTRDLDEGGRIISNAKPSHDRAFFDSAEVEALWPAASAAAKTALAWMAREAEAFLKARGDKPKRDDLVGKCVTALDVSFRDATAAHTKLPDHLRRKRGEKGRKVKSDG